MLPFLRSCHSAILQFAQDLAAQCREPKIVTVMGDSNVGKTVYLGFLLDMLSQRANDYEAIPKGAYSVDLQQTVITRLWIRTQHERRSFWVLRVRESMDSQMQDAKLIKWLLLKSGFRGILAEQHYGVRSNNSTDFLDLCSRLWKVVKAYP